MDIMAILWGNVGSRVSATQGPLMKAIAAWCFFCRGPLVSETALQGSGKGLVNLKMVCLYVLASGFAR